MSTLQITIEPILEIKPHNNADSLELITIKGWQVVVKKDIFRVGELVVFIPPDSILPKTLHEFLGITKYCAELPKRYSTPKDIDLNEVMEEQCLYGNPPDLTLERPSARKVKAARLRGEASYGTIMSLQSFKDYIYKQNQTSLGILNVPGLNVVSYLNIHKWEPPVKDTSGEQAKDHPCFHKYTDIENWRNYPGVFEDGEEIFVFSKINGTNSRLGYMPDENQNLIHLAGSHNVNKKEFNNEGEPINDLYWQPYQWYPQIKDLQKELCGISYNDGKVTYPIEQPVIVFGEIFGAGVQDMTYGLTKKDFRVFDISVGGKYVGWDLVKLLCKKFNIPTVIELYRGPYSKQIIEEHTSGSVVECEPDKIIGKFKGREGIVFRPIYEQTNPIIGRKILKSVSVDYLERKNATDSH